MECTVIGADWKYGIFLKGVKSSNFQIVNYIIKPVSEYWLDFDVPCMTFSLCWQCLKYGTVKAQFLFDIFESISVSHWCCALFHCLGAILFHCYCYLCLDRRLFFIVFCSCDLFNMVRPGPVHNAFTVGVVTFLHIHY
jgi:hypothetical protein